MKKAFSFGLLAVAVALSFLSCKNNNSDLKKVTKVSLSETIKIIEVGEEFTLKETEVSYGPPTNRMSLP